MFVALIWVMSTKGWRYGRQVCCAGHRVYDEGYFVRYDVKDAMDK